MGSVDRCDPTLPLNEMMFYVRRSKELRERWTTDLSGLCREFGVTEPEYEALRDQDVKRLHELGVHQYYVPQMLRLFYGASANSNAHPALEAYKRAYPAESARALALAERLESEDR
jgi:aromatic-ring opening dioxygenase LigAB LigA subunit